MNKGGDPRYIQILIYRQHFWNQVGVCSKYVQIAEQDDQSTLKPVWFDTAYGQSNETWNPSAETVQFSVEALES